MADRFKEWTEDIQVAGGDLNRTMRGLFEDMTVSRIVVRRPNGTKLFELPAAAGLAAGVLLWQFSLVAVGVARLANYRIHVVRQKTVPAEEDLEVIIEEIIDDTSWPDEPTEDIPIMDSADKPNEDESISLEEIETIIVPTAETSEEPFDIDDIETIIVSIDDEEKPFNIEDIETIVMPTADVSEPAETTADGDDFSRIRWIGPTYENILKAAGISNYSALANAEPDALRAIFEAENVAPPDVNAWREQAKALMQSS